MDMTPPGLTPQHWVNVLWSAQRAPIWEKTYQKNGRKPQKVLSEKHCYELLACIDFFLERWLYVLIITIDTNYHMKLKEKGLATDPPLGDGWSHFVQTKPYHVYVKQYGNQIEVSCFSLC